MSSNQITMLVILIGYLVLNVAIGLFMAKRQDSQSKLSDEKKYFIGGRGMNGLVLAMTTMATYTSVSSFVSGPGAAGMTAGYAQAWIAAVQVGVTYFILGVIGNKFALVSRRTGAVTVAGYLRARYKSDILVIVCSLLMVAFFIGQMMAQFKGGADLIRSITNLPYWAALAIFALVVIVYTSFGGFTAVVITDTIQGLIMCAGTFLMLFFCLRAGGGLSGINATMAERLPTFDNLTASVAPGMLMSYWILVGVGTLGLPQTAVRGMGFKSTKNLHSAMIIGCITCAFVIVGMHTAGVWAGALTDTAALDSSDLLIPVVVQEIMPVGLAGIFLAAPMAAVMSTVSSLLILASAAIIKDLWRNYVVKDDPKKIESYNKNVGKASIAATLVLGIIVFIISLKPTEIVFLLNTFAMGGLECAFLWPLVGGIFWKKGTKQAALCSSIVSVATYILFHYNPAWRPWGVHAVVFGLVIGGIVYFAVGAATSKDGLDQDILEKCF